MNAKIEDEDLSHFFHAQLHDRSGGRTRTATRARIQMRLEQARGARIPYAGVPTGEPITGMRAYPGLASYGEGMLQCLWRLCKHSVGCLLTLRTLP